AVECSHCGLSGDLSGGLISMVLIATLATLLAIGLISGHVWQKKGGNYATGFILGALLGIIGFALVMMMGQGSPIAESVAPADAPLSADGVWFWDGAAWQPAHAQVSRGVPA